MAEPVFRVEGLRQFRRELKELPGTIDREVQVELRDVARRVAREASASAPKRTGMMAGAYRGTASRGLRASVTNRVFYSRMIEFGFHPRGSATAVAGRNVIGTVLERDEDRIVDEIGDAMERAIRKAGWS